MIDVFRRMTPAGRASAFGLASVALTVVWLVLLLFFIDRGGGVSGSSYSVSGVVNARCGRFEGDDSILVCGVQVVELEQLRRVKIRLYIDSARCNGATLAVGSEVKLLVGRADADDRYKVWRAEDAHGCVLYDEDVSSHIVRVTNGVVFGYASFFFVLSCVCAAFSAWFWLKGRASA